VPTFVAVVFALTLSSPARTQEEEAQPVVVDEVVVQVNSDVVTLSMLKRQSADVREALINQRNATAEQADAEIASRQPEIILNLISDTLLLQKGKEIPRLSEDAEAEVNRELLRSANSQGIKTLGEFEAAAQEAGVSIPDIKDMLRRQYTKQAVLQREVDARIYYGLTDAELRTYYDANRARFLSVTLSEIFLSLAGHGEGDVQAKAAEIVAAARGGADFGELAAKNSEHQTNGVRIAETTKGQLLDEKGQPRFYLLSEVPPVILNAIKDVTTGGISDPIKTDDGYTVLRVNARDDSFKENLVRTMMTQERSEKEREEYLRKLRREAFIKPAPSYGEVIQPLLDKDRA